MLPQLLILNLTYVIPNLETTCTYYNMSLTKTKEELIIIIIIIYYYFLLWWTFESYQTFGKILCSIRRFGWTRVLGVEWIICFLLATHRHVELSNIIMCAYVPIVEK